MVIFKIKIGKIIVYLRVPINLLTFPAVHIIFSNELQHIILIY